MSTAIIYLGQDPAFADKPMVELNYIKEFEAKVTGRGPSYVTLDRTAFYAESGGQVGDQGRLSRDNNLFLVEDTRKQGQAHVHIGAVEQGSFSVGDSIRADIDYGTAVAKTTYGVLGIKVWIFKGEVIGAEEAEAS